MKILETNCPNIQDENGGKVIFPFGPCIYQNFISDELRDSLLNAGREARDKDRDYREYLAGNMYNGGSFEYDDSYTEEIYPQLLKYLFMWFDFMVHHYGEKRINFAPGGSDIDIGISSLWINFQRMFDHNPPHQHSGIVSFVIYLDVPPEIFTVQAKSNVQDAGHIVFKYGESISPLSVSMWNVVPENNLILLFPATLDHMVHPFWVDKERISVSGNFNLTNKVAVSLNGA